MEEVTTSAPVVTLAPLGEVLALVLLENAKVPLVEETPAPLEEAKAPAQLTRGHGQGTNAA